LRGSTAAALLIAKKFARLLTFIIVGKDLQKCYHRNGKTGYLVLLNNVNTGDLIHEKSRLLKCLRGPYRYNTTTSEIIFESGLVLNIHNVTVHDELAVVEPKNLFSYRRKKLRSVYTFWKDPEFTLRGLMSQWDEAMHRPNMADAWSYTLQ
jgi:hypothetical protein